MGSMEMIVEAYNNGCAINIFEIVDKPVVQLSKMLLQNI